MPLPAMQASEARAYALSAEQELGNVTLCALGVGRHVGRWAEGGCACVCLWRGDGDGAAHLKQTQTEAGSNLHGPGKHCVHARNGC